MMVYVLSAVVFLIAFTGLAVGTIVAGRRLRGSCGGLSGFRDEQGNPMCESCTNPAAECDDFRKQQAEPVHSSSADDSSG
jgi:hypothetical protein